MDYWFFILLAVIGAAVITFFVVENILNKKVLSVSIRIKNLLKLNQDINFYIIKSNLGVSKHYDNKGNFTKIEPAYLMTAELRNNIGFYSDYISKIQDNRKKLIEYDRKVQEAYDVEAIIDYENLKMSEQAFLRRERRLFDKNKISPVTNCVFTVRMSYSSPKGKVNLSKAASFNFDQMVVCFESISRSRLDKNTRKALSLTERGEVSDSLRYDILRRDNFTCVICGSSAKEGARLHVDHIVPIAKGGKSVPENLRTLCERCNIGKSDKTESIDSNVSDTVTRSNPLNNEQQTNNDTCPMCGAKLILRNGKYGKFYGCSNYPKCKYTRNI